MKNWSKHEANRKKRFFKIIDSGKIALLIVAVMVLLTVFNTITIRGTGTTEINPPEIQPMQTGGDEPLPTPTPDESGNSRKVKLLQRRLKGLRVPVKIRARQKTLIKQKTPIKQRTQIKQNIQIKQKTRIKPRIQKTPRILTKPRDPGLNRGSGRDREPEPTPTPIPTKTPRPTDPPLPSTVPSVPTIIEETPTPTPSFEDIEPGGEVELQEDMHGYIIRIAGWWDEAKTNKNIAALVKEFEKKYNCQVLFMDMTQKKVWDKLLESKATGRPYIDAVFLEAHDVMGKMMPYGLLAPINPYYSEKELNAIPESYLKILSKGKNLYAVPAKAPNFSGIWCNMDLLTSMGIPNINQLYLNNEWTWEKFNKFMYDTTIDRDRTGYNERFGIAVGVDIFPGLIAASGGNIITWNGTNFKVDIHNSRAFSALDFARTIHTTGYVAYESEKFFYIYRSGFLSGESWMASKVKQYLKANSLFVPYPVPGSTEPYRAMAVSAR